MTLLRLFHRSTTCRHAWHETEVYGKTVTANLCKHCGAPAASIDAKKVEISRMLVALYGQPDQAPFGKVWFFVSEQLRPFLEEQRKKQPKLVSR